REQLIGGALAIRPSPVHLAAGAQVGRAAHMTRANKKVAVAKFIKQRQRLCVERSQPARAGVAVMAGAEMLGVRAPAHHATCLKHLDGVTGLLQSVGSSHSGRAGAYNSDVHTPALLYVFTTPTTMSWRARLRMTKHRVMRRICPTLLYSNRLRAYVLK